MDIVLADQKKHTYESSPICPICMKAGQKVNLKTVSSLIKLELIDSLTDDVYFICLSHDCQVSYYTTAGNFYMKDDITVPIWFKEESPVTVCYCKNVSDKDILYHVVEKKCCADIEDIQLHTGANTGKECLTKNPTGK